MTTPASTATATTAPAVRIALPGTPLLVRAALVVAAGVATAVQAPTAIRTLLAVLALGGLGDLYIRRHRDGGRPAVAAAVAIAVVGTIGVGLLLNLVPSGLNAPGWAAGLTALGLAMIAVQGRDAHRRPEPLDTDSLDTEPHGTEPRETEPPGSGLRDRPDLRGLLRTDGFWYAGAAVLVLAGLTLAVTVTHTAERAPVQLSAETSATGDVSVTISSAAAAGPFDLWLEDGRKERLLRTGIPIAAGRPLEVPLQRFGDRQMRVALRNSGSDDDVRFVIVNPGE